MTASFETRQEQAEAVVRACIATGKLPPGAFAPSAVQLAEATGVGVAVCRLALRNLVADGTLTVGPNRSSNYRVADPGPGFRPIDAGLGLTAAMALSSSLAVWRDKAGLTQEELGRRMGRESGSVIGHAETGRLWQDRLFWVEVDEALDAGGVLVSLYDEYERLSPDRAMSASTASKVRPEVAAVVLIWDTGLITTTDPDGARLRLRV